MIGRISLLALVGLMFVQPLTAHQRSESFSIWKWNDEVLELRFTVAGREAARVLYIQNPQFLETGLADHLEGLIGPDDQDAGCVPVRPVAVRTVTGNFLRADAAWRCDAAPRQLRVDAFFELANEHVHMSTFEMHGRTIQTFLHADRTVWLPLMAEDDKQIAESSGLERFSLSLGLGFRHALSGYDHLAFIIALLLVCTSLKSLVWAITGFTLGHSISLCLTALGFVVPHIPMVEATIGLTIMLVAAERLRPGLVSALIIAVLAMAVLLAAGTTVASQSTALMISGMGLFVVCYLLLSSDSGDTGWFRMSAAMLFGLVHGFGFASAFQAAGLSSSKLAWSLAGFNIGIEVAQILVVVAVFLLIQIAVRNFGRKPIAADLLATALCAIGTFWFLTRSIGV